MKRTLTIVSFGDRLPLSFDIVQFDSVLRHMHSTAQLLLVLKGSCAVSLSGGKVNLGPSGLFMVDANTFHALEADGECILVSVLLDLKGFGLDAEEAASLHFRPNSSLDPENPRYESIRYLIYSMIKYNTMENANSIYTNRAIAYSFFSQLMNDFKETEEGKQGAGKVDAITLLTSYLEDHYAENVSLAFLAKEFGYSVPYLSRLFKEATGKTYLDYYDAMRVNYSSDDLLNSKKTMEEVALSNGFENARSFVRAFRKVHGEYPSSFREKHRKGSRAYQSSENDLRKEALDLIISGYDSYNEAHRNVESVRDTSVYLALDANAKTRKSSNPAHRILSVEKPSLLIAESVKNPLRAIQGEAPFPILEIRRFLEWEWPFFYSKEEKRVNTPFLFTVLDDVLSLGFTPYLRFHYDPQYVDESTYAEVSKGLLRDLLAHYGEEKTKKWIIGFGGDLLSEGFSKTIGSLLDFACGLPSFRLASPILPLGQPAPLTRSFLSRHASELDFHCFDASPSGYLSRPNEPLDALKALQEEGLAPEKKTILEGYSFTGRPKELLLDTAFASSFLGESSLLLFHSAYALSYDAFRADEAFQDSKNPFLGSHAFLSLGIKKASCRALNLLAKLGNEEIPTDGSFLATKTENGLALLFVNYCHYSNLYASEAYYELTETDRYRCFPKGTRVHYHLKLEGLNAKRCLVKEYEVSKEQGSAFDTWVRMGAPEELGSEEIKIIRGHSETGLAIHEENASAGRLNIEFSLEPLGLKVIEISLL